MVSDQPYPCPRATCRGHLSNAVRYHADGTAPLRTRVCWECGWEQFPLPCCNREPARTPIAAVPKADPRWSRCAAPDCRAWVYVTLLRRARGKGRYCSHDCRMSAQVRRTAS